MKNLKSFAVIALIAAMAVFSCGGGDGGDGNNNGESQLSGTITIEQDGTTVEDDVYTYEELYANYSGSETVSYQWKLGATPVGQDDANFTPEEAGQYTVTVSAPGKISKTSAEVTVIDNPNLFDLAGSVLFFIDNDLDPATTAETGQKITALYEGTEDVSYQWYKDGAVIPDPDNFEHPDNTIWIPLEAGSYTVRLTATYGGYFPLVWDPPVVVTGQNKITITFDLNGPEGENQKMIIDPGTPLGSLPAPPAYNGFTFRGWYTSKTGGTKLSETSSYNASRTVYAQWSFGGGVPYIEGTTLVHPNPKMEQAAGFAGTISAVDGTVRFTAGSFVYMWPSSPGGEFNIGDYAYCIVEFDLIGYAPGTGSDPKAGSGVRLLRANNTTDYQSVDSVWPWLTNISGSIRFPLSGAGDTGGFAIRYNGAENGYIELKITSITFYQVVQHTVTFALNGGDGSDPVSKQAYHNETLGAQFPVKPVRTNYTFTGWKDQDDAIVTATTPIMKDLQLTAQWVLTSTLIDSWMELISTSATSVPVYAFSLPQASTFGDYDRITLKVKQVDTGTEGRARAYGTLTAGDFAFNATTGAQTASPSIGTINGGNSAAGTRVLSTAGMSAIPSTWTTVTIQFNNRASLNAAATINATVGIALVAAGYVADGGGTDSRSYYVKDIVLTNQAGTNPVPALFPYDTNLWSGNGASAFIGAANSVTRQILLAED